MRHTLLRIYADRRACGKNFFRNVFWQLRQKICKVVFQSFFNDQSVKKQYGRIFKSQCDTVLFPCTTKYLTNMLKLIIARRCPSMFPRRPVEEASVDASRCIIRNGHPDDCLHLGAVFSSRTTNTHLTLLKDDANEESRMLIWWMRSSYEYSFAWILTNFIWIVSHQSRIWA